MKLKSIGIGLLILASASLEVLAQTNTTPTFQAGAQQIYDAVTTSTNFGLALGGGRSTTGNRNLAYGDFVYNVSQAVGLVIGYDYLWTSTKGVPAQANLVKGGLTIQAPLQPFKNVGWTNVVVTPYAFALVATGNGSMSQILGGGINYKLTEWKGFKFNVGLLYEQRTDAGYWDAKYIAGTLAITHGF